MRWVCLLLAIMPSVKVHASTTMDLLHHPVRQISFWKDYRQNRIEDRIFAAPSSLLDYLNLDNKLHGYAQKPSFMELNPQLKLEIRQAILTLPLEFLSLVNSHLIGIFVVKNLGTSAFTDYTFDSQNQPSDSYIVLDAETLKNPANAWITKKEISPFDKNDSSINLRVKLENTRNNNHINAIQYALLHEMGHVIGLAHSTHPRWGESDSKFQKSEDYPFSRLSWQNDHDRFQRRKDSHSPMPGPLSYYLGTVHKPSIKEAIFYYDWLETTDFPTLYGSMNPFDDFAESLATYIHTMMLGKPYEVAILQDGAIKKLFHACWGQSRCAIKQRLLESLLFNSIDSSKTSVNSPFEAKDRNASR